MKGMYLNAITPADILPPGFVGTPWEKIYAVMMLFVSPTLSADPDGFLASAAALHYIARGDADRVASAEAIDADACSVAIPAWVPSAGNIDKAKSLLKAWLLYDATPSAFVDLVKSTGVHTAELSKTFAGVPAIYIDRFRDSCLYTDAEGENAPTFFRDRIKKFMPITAAAFFVIAERIPGANVYYLSDDQTAVSVPRNVIPGSQLYEGDGSPVSLPDGLDETMTRLFAASDAAGLIYDRSVDDNIGLRTSTSDAVFFYQFFASMLTVLRVYAKLYEGAPSGDGVIPLWVTDDGQPYTLPASATRSLYDPQTGSKFAPTAPQYDVVSFRDYTSGLNNRSGNGRAIVVSLPSGSTLDFGILGLLTSATIDRVYVKQHGLTVRFLVAHLSATPYSAAAFSYTSTSNAPLVWEVNTRNAYRGADYPNGVVFGIRQNYADMTFGPTCTDLYLDYETESYLRCRTAGELYTNINNVTFAYIVGDADVETVVVYRLSDNAKFKAIHDLEGDKYLILDENYASNRFVDAQGVTAAGYSLTVPELVLYATSSASETAPLIAEGRNAYPVYTAPNTAAAFDISTDVFKEYIITSVCALGVWAANNDNFSIRVYNNSLHIFNNKTDSKSVAAVKVQAKTIENAKVGYMREGADMYAAGGADMASLPMYNAAGDLVAFDTSKAYKFKRLAYSTKNWSEFYSNVEFKLEAYAFNTSLLGVNVGASVNRAQISAVVYTDDDPWFWFWHGARIEILSSAASLPAYGDGRWPIMMDPIGSMSPAFYCDNAYEIEGVEGDDVTAEDLKTLRIVGGNADISSGRDAKRYKDSPSALLAVFGARSKDYTLSRIRVRIRPRDLYSCSIGSSTYHEEATSIGQIIQLYDYGTREALVYDGVETPCELFTGMCTYRKSISDSTWYAAGYHQFTLLPGGRIRIENSYAGTLFAMRLKL